LWEDGDDARGRFFGNLPSWSRAYLLRGDVPAVEAGKTDAILKVLSQNQACFARLFAPKAGFVFLPTRCILL
jgi:hypothetical protein